MEPNNHLPQRKKFMKINNRLVKNKITYAEWGGVGFWIEGNNFI